MPVKCDKIPRTCEFCGVHFEVWPSRVKEGKSRFCSKGCRAAFESRESSVIRTCAFCGQEFRITLKQFEKRRGAYCSRECCDSASRAKMICEQCGIEFTTKVSKIKNGCKYCSRECMGLATRNRVKVNCEYCGKEFERRKEHALRDCRNFCNQDCWKAFEREFSPKGEERWGYVERVKVHCAHCGKEVIRKATYVAGYEHQFCDNGCKGAFFSGANSPNWAGGAGKIYYGPNWQRQRRKARKRDGYKCQYCGVPEKKLGKQLDVHHIRPFREFGYIPEGPDANNNYKEANRLRNLICLCQEHHKMAEYGVIVIQPYLL